MIPTTPYKKITFGGRTLITLTLFGVLLGSVVMPLGPVAAQGVEPDVTAGTVALVQTAPGDENPLPECGITELSGCLVQLTNLIFKLSVLVLRLVGMVFDTAIAFSLSSQVIDSDFAREGWKIVRDIANLVFIFILLYIAFGTMLGLGGINMRSALANLIVVALLINFSMFFTRVVIDAGNTLAFAFYNSFELPSGATQRNVGDVAIKNISDFLVAGFQPQQVFSDESFAKWKDSKVGHVGLAFVFVSASVIVFMFAWALLTASVLFLVRIPALWLLMIAAPAAFAAWIIPGMRNRSKQWWDMLLNQSFVVAFFLFFVYLIVKFIVETPFFADIGIGGSESGGNDLADLFLLILTVLFKFAIIYILIKIAVSQAKALSGQAGTLGLNAATGAFKWGRGFATRRTAGLRSAIGTAVAARAARAAEDFQKSGGRVAGTLRRIPVLGTAATTALGRIGARAEADIQKMEAELKTLSDDAVKNVAASTLSGTRRAAAVRLLAQRGNLTAARDFNAQDIGQAVTELKNRNISTKAVESLRWQYSTTPAERAAPDTIKTITPANVEKLKADWFTDPSIAKEMYKQFHGGHMRNILEHNDAGVPTGFFDQLASMMYTDPVYGPRPVGRNIPNVKAFFTQIGNQRLLKWVQSPEGKNTLRTYGFT